MDLTKAMGTSSSGVRIDTHGIEMSNMFRKHMHEIYSVDKKRNIINIPCSTLKMSDETGSKLDGTC